MGRAGKFSPEVRERAVRLVLTHQGEHASQWAASESIAGKIGCSAEVLRKWVRQAERDQGARPSNCGSCSNVCPPTTPTCTGGTCH